MVLRGTTAKTMLITVHTQQFLAEAASTVHGLPCWHSSDATRRYGNVLVLAGRDAR